MKTCDSKYCNCLYHSVNALSRVVTNVADEEFAKTGLTSSYAFLLMTVNEKPGIQPTEISMHLQLKPSTITRLIEKMENKGLLQRNYCGRCTEVHPTEEGKKMQAKIKKAWKGLYERLSEVLGKERVDELTVNIYDSCKQLDNK